LAPKAYFSGMADRAGPGVPTLVVVSGPAGCGKTTLAHRLAAALGCPAICRDEIKEGMARTQSDDLDRRTLAVFFDELRLLLERGVTVVAEAAFQDHVWTPNLVSLAPLCEFRVVQCHTDSATAKHRVAEHVATRHVHDDEALLSELERGDDYFTAFRRVSIAAPAIDVDTTDRYRPAIDEIVAFVDAR
jgi:predicted kinase